jgi:3-oxoacyl-[acyl-carrier protein] reductase
MFKDKNVLVTGGAGFIGKEICRLFKAYNANVIFTYFKSESKAQQLTDEIGCKSISVNLEDVKDIKLKIEKLYSEINRIDILVNNAAISQILPLSMLEEEDVDKVFDINLKGTLFVTKAVIRGMIRNKSGVIVNMGSLAGNRMLDVPVTYAMSKAAINGFTISLASELKKFGIRVNSVVPGLMEGGVATGVPDDLREDFIKHCATGRAGKAIEVAELVCFLASEKASYINGQNITIDGGI